MTLDTLKAAFASAFILLLAIGAITTFARVIYLRRQSHALPRLLIRDVLFFFGFSWTVVVILVVRAIGAPPGLGDQLWWVLLTSVPPIVSLLVYCYFELFVIGRSE